MINQVNIIGAGLAGSEAAWQLAKRNIKVKLFDMKPAKYSPAHKNSDFAELVCSNSFRSDDITHNAVGLMHQEMRLFGSLIMQCADLCKVPAGGALAVDREGFAAKVTEQLKNHPLIEFVSQEVTELPPPDAPLTIIATGPLTSPDLINAILQKVDNQSLSFYDAIAPVVYKDSIDFSKAWYQSRYDKGDKFDYINCPLSKEQYYHFVDELLKAEKMPFHDFEEPHYFDGCLPIEVMAERGIDTLLFGPMKPVGLTNPNSSERPFAVVQLRQDNKEDTLRNIVGFQTKLKYGEQERIFRLIPGLEHAEFARLGGIHKNTFIQSPLLLNHFLQLNKQPNLMFAGQISGCEGYVESANVGMLAGYYASCLINNQAPLIPPPTTATGAMLCHLQDTTSDYQPMNINFGLFPPIPPVVTPKGKLHKIKGAERKEAYCQRAMTDFTAWLEQINAI
ncbi:MAG: methylenetetrahydrofolate--tRNA-(uracil(54)-C(5))-methyltransferase (FADH(2)-oxidizing) TrmFO, partial [Alphaproteobacteria bacterium]|nr:methylenetetrahydrofolate--tRNA-(uracil(54)-C(5))-methyltransferase (FADH(2)-oxidizing) TrmFO [Alphaproteobacteria bacterium]